MNKKIKIGVLGCSNIANKSVIPAILENPNFELVSVASRSLERGKLFADKFNTEWCDYEQLVLSNQVEAVYVSLPVALHYDWGKQVVLSGKHLLLEKPFTDTFSKAKEIIDLAKGKNVIAMEALMYSYHPLFLKVKELIKKGEIGELRSIEAVFGFPELPADDIRNKKQLGGGAILDGLVYPLSLSLNIAEDTPYDYTYNIIRNKKYDVDFRGSLLLHFENFSSHITYGFGFMYRNEYLIWGSEGYLSVNRAFSRPADLPGEIKIIKQNYEEIIKIPPANHFSKMLDAFYFKISGMDMSNGNENMEILQRMNIISDLYEKINESKAF